jgi:hypothetical protein
VLRLTPRVPFAVVFGWLALSSHPLIKLILFLGVVLGTIVLVVVAVVALMVDVVTFPVRLLL